MSEQSDPTTTTTPLRKVLGEKTAKALATHLDLHTAGDLIYHFPRRYDERGEHTDMRDLRIGEQVTLLAQVQSVSVKPNMIIRKKSAIPTTSFVRRLLYFTCMKNRTTSVALVTAIAIATGKLSEPRFTNATATVIAVSTISAPKMV